MNRNPVTTSLPSPLIAVAALVVIVAGLREMSTILVPLLLAVFIAIICWPPLFWLYRRGLPYGLSIVVVIAGIVGIITALSLVVGTSAEHFIGNLPKYQAQLRQQERNLIAWIDAHDGVQMPYDSLLPLLDPGQIMVMVANALSRFGSVLTNLLLILLTVAFILMEALLLPKKLKLAFGGEHAFAHFERFAASVKHYLAIKSITSLATGALVGFALWLIEVDYPILWGLVAFFLNFIPSIGSILASLPAILLALTQFGPAVAGYTVLIYLAVNITIGSIIEPRVMGEGLGLSTLVVFLSLIFWGWVFGPIGMLLSVPFTMILKIALENMEETRWLAILMDSGRDIESLSRERNATTAPLDQTSGIGPDRTIGSIGKHE